MTTRLEMFAPIAARYRRLSRTGLISMAVGIVVGLLAGFAHLQSRWTDWTLVILWGVSWGTMITAHTLLKCPICAVCLHRTHGPFCPNCGRRALSNSGLSSTPACNQCGCTLRMGKNRRYRIRYCNHCGSHLDIEGV